jgi:hypothetical protein
MVEDAEIRHLIHPASCFLNALVDYESLSGRAVEVIGPVPAPADECGRWFEVRAAWATDLVPWPRRDCTAAQLAAQSRCDRSDHSRQLGTSTGESLPGDLQVTLALPRNLHCAYQRLHCGRTGTSRLRAGSSGGLTRPMTLLLVNSSFRSKLRH